MLIWLKDTYQEIEKKGFNIKRIDSVRKWPSDYPLNDKELW